MKRALYLLLIMILCLGFFGCGNKDASSTSADGTGGVPTNTPGTSSDTKTATKKSDAAPLDDDVIRVCLLINGNLGDMSFFDSANAGMTRFAADYQDAEVKIVEMGSDTTMWEPTLRQTANEAYDLIIVGTTDMREPLQRLVRNAKYKDRRFIIFDTEIEDNSASNYPTVHSILFKQNEGGYLAGILAALMSKELDADKTGFIGGMKIDIINDFGYGFMEGVQRINNEKGTRILAYNSYIGDFTNSPKGKSLADTMYSQNVEILFACASQAGLGCLDSAKNNHKLVIGVDSDQYGYFKSSDPGKASQIVTSVLKRVDLALYEACELFLNGKLTFGDLAYLGVAEDKIALANNENYQRLVSESIRAYINECSAAIGKGELKVGSGLRRFTSTSDLNSMFDSLDPNKQ